jgi:hypothetical protein
VLCQKLAKNIQVVEDLEVDSDIQETGAGTLKVCFELGYHSPVGMPNIKGESIPKQWRSQCDISPTMRHV